MIHVLPPTGNPGVGFGPEQYVQQVCRHVLPTALCRRSQARYLLAAARAALADRTAVMAPHALRTDSRHVAHHAISADGATRGVTLERSVAARSDAATPWATSRVNGSCRSVNDR